MVCKYCVIFKSALDGETFWSVKATEERARGQNLRGGNSKAIADLYKNIICIMLFNPQVISNKGLQVNNNRRGKTLLKNAKCLPTFLLCKYFSDRLSGRFFFKVHLFFLFCLSIRSIIILIFLFANSVLAWWERAWGMGVY